MSMKKNFQNMPHASIRTQHGFTLIELLVATIIGLLGTIVIFTVYQNAEGFKRTTVSTGDAQTSGAIALYSIEQYIRTAGSGITTTNEAKFAGVASTVRPNLLLGCPLQPNPNGVLGAVTTVGATPTPVAPVRIIDGSLIAGGLAGSSDVLVIMGGNADMATNPTSAGPLAAGDPAVIAANLLGWRTAAPGRAADIALFVQGSGTTSNVSTINCSMRRIATISSASGSGVITLASPTAISYGLTTNVHDYFD
jgi:prepilin-type N-terminal cleavage/methylation domain-containing protein